MLRRDSKRIWCGFTNSCFHGRTPMESISTTSSLSSQRTNSGKAKSSIFQQRILMVRHGTEWSQLPVSSSLNPKECLFFFFFTPPQHCRYIATSDLSTGSRWVSWWTVQSERNWESSPRMSPGEVHARSWKNIRYYQKPAFALSCFYCASRPGGGSVHQHGGRFHETCGGCGRPAAERRSQRHCLQRAAGSHSGHHGCAPPSTRAALLLMSMAFYTHAYRCESLQVRSCGWRG